MRADGDCDSNYTLTRTWTATDDCGNTASEVQVITVQDTTAPVLEPAPDDITVECDAVPTASATDLSATDNCDADVTVTYNEVRADGDCDSNYTLTRTWTATDECGNTTVHTQIVTVEDTTAPVTTTDFETEISITCGNIPDVPELDFEDACSSDISVEFEETSTFDGTTNDFEIIRTWTVTDECNNTAIYTQTIFVTNESNIISSNTELCIYEDFEFDLFDLLSGDYDTNGEWQVTSGNATLNGSLFNPSSLLNSDGTFDFGQLGDYVFTYVTNGECPTETEVIITINDICIPLACGDADEVIISKAVTANGDQWNEYFTITGIEGCGFTVEVQIFNRWGALIYESKDYQNNWNAFVHGNSVGGSDKVPTGTYYYIINLKNSGLKPFAGPIYVGTK